MEKYSIQQISEKLNITKQTLRYYETMQLISPERGENRYRYYKKKDINDLLYIQLMKYAGFSLKEIKTVLSNKRNISAPKESIESSMIVLKRRKKKMEQTIVFLQGLVQLSDVFMETLKGKKSGKDMDDLVEKIYENVFEKEK